MSQRHYPPQTNKITLSTAADGLLSITAPSPGQQIGLDNQTAQTTFTGPAGGSSAAPTFKNNSDITMPSVFLLMGA